MQSPTLPRFLVAGAFLGLLGGAAYYARARLMPEREILQGVRVDGVEIADGDVRGTVERRAQALRARKVRLVVADEGGGHVLKEVTLGELGVRVDVDRVVATVTGLGKGNDIVSQYELAASAREGKIDVPLLPSVDAPVAIALLESFKEAEDIAPIPARLDLDHQAVVREKDGKYLDVDGGIAAIQRVALSPGYVNDPVTRIVVPMASFTPRLSSAFLANIDIHEKLYEYETKFSRAAKNRTRNIEVASARLDGVVLMPGASMSFNEVVGARSEENGFQKAGEIFKGEMIEGVGGGTCQAASTLHAIAFFGGLDIVERLPHSRQSGYIRLGLDATVVYPSVDLKLRNPFDFPVVIHTRVESDKVVMQLLGKRKPVDVKFESAVIGSFAFTRKVQEEPWVSKVSLKQKGSRGLQVKRTRTFTFSDGQKKVETSVDTYPPVIEIYRVPFGFDATELPALGEDFSADSNDAARKPPAGGDPYAPVARQKQG